MSQIGESANMSITTGGTIKCIFCNKNHQDSQEEPKTTFKKVTKDLKKAGREYIPTNSSRKSIYPYENEAPLKDWSSISQADKKKGNFLGYFAAAHHLVAVKSLNGHDLSGEIKKAEYNPDNGHNCIFLPYGRDHFIRARAENKGLQKHSGGHTNVYFEMVKRKLTFIKFQIKQKFCLKNKKADKDYIKFRMKIIEDHIWNGVVSAVRSVYKLHSDAFLDPKLPWGYYKPEENDDKNVFLKKDIITIEIPAREDDDPEG